MSRPFRSFLAVALIAHLLAVVAMAASPQWHEKAHHDAHDSSHECAVSHFLGGTLNDAAPPMILTAVVLPCLEVLPMEAAREVFPAQVENPIRERAPPVQAV